MDTNSSWYQKAVAATGSSPTVQLETAPPKRKASVPPTVFESKRMSKALKPMGFNVEPVLIEQLSSSEYLC